MKNPSSIFKISLIVPLLLVFFVSQSSAGTKRDAPVDMDGDGRTDFVIARSAGPSGTAVNWYCAMASGEIVPPMSWGETPPPPQAGRDLPISGDFDGDRKDDIAVWRPGEQGRFFVINSSTMTITVVALGTTGDDPTVIGDYNGDRRDDFAVYRHGQWYYQTDPQSMFVRVDFGRRKDRPAPGDYDGDGTDDIAVVRYPNPETAVYYMLLSTGGFTANQLDLRNSEPILESVVVQGDYDGDRKTDLANVIVLNDAERTLLWRYLGSSDGQIYSAQWGKLTGAWDWVVPGDYNGDGRFDFAVWRMEPPGTYSKFYVLTSGTGEIFTKEWGENNHFRDYPVANGWKGPIVIFWGWM